MIVEPKEIASICLDCSAALFPDDSNANVVNAGRLLFGTAAHESAGFWYSRQIGFSNDTIRGAWSLWQVEAGSVRDSIAYMRRRPDLAQRAAMWAYGSDTTPYPWDGKLLLDMMRMLQHGHKTACIFARLHYRRVPRALPKDVLDDAGYWKRWYNTALGKGTVEQYLKHWEQFASVWNEALTERNES